MKIKAVCEQTGLTDRTIRYYIEEGLIAPAYTENYMGRKTFDFSEADIRALADIAVLREFSFSIEEIRAILNDPKESRPILLKVKERVDTSAAASRRKQSALLTLDPDAVYTVAELAHALSLVEDTVPVQETVTDARHSRLLRLLQLAAAPIAVLLPLLLGVLTPLLRHATLPYPTVSSTAMAITGLTLLPSVALGLLTLTGRHSRRAVRRVLLTLCTLAIPLSFFCARESVTDCQHQYDAFTVQEAATCTAEGSLTRRCTACGHTDTTAISRLPHSIVIDAAVPPTCARAGRTEGAHCEVCGTITLASAQLPRPDHRPVTDPPVVPTCDSDGLTEGSHCGDCGEVLVAQRVMPHLFHQHTRTYYEPTCGTRGYASYRCDFCDDTFTLKLTPPTYDHVIVPDAAGEGEDYHCLYCGIDVYEYCPLYPNDPTENLYYYVTGPRYLSSYPFPERTLVITGTGALPDFPHYLSPPWIRTTYLSHITTVVIDKEITAIGTNSFKTPDGVYSGIKSFIIKNPSLVPNSNAIADIKCPITYP